MLMNLYLIPTLLFWNMYERYVISKRKLLRSKANSHAELK